MKFKDKSDNEYEVAYILDKDAERNHEYEVVGFNDDSGIAVNPSTKEETYLPDWDYSIDDNLFGLLESPKIQIEYMTPQMHYNIWNYVEELYPEDIMNKQGLDNYLEYCTDNNITRDTITKNLNLKESEVPDILEIVAEYKKNKDQGMEV